jgi:hypothetical protein
MAKKCRIIRRGLEVGAEMASQYLSEGEDIHNQYRRFTIYFKLYEVLMVILQSHMTAKHWLHYTSLVFGPTVYNLAQSMRSQTSHLGVVLSE